MQARKNPAPKISSNNFNNNKNIINKNANNNIAGKASPREQKNLIPPQPHFKKQLSD